MRLKLRDNAAQVERDIDKFVEGVIRAKVRAANTVIAQAARAGFAEINAVYQIPAKTMSQYASIRLASEASAEASITVKGKGFPLSTFKPIPTPNGVSVIIKGRRIVVPHSFLIARFGSHVFARGSYKGAASRPTGQTSGRFTYDRGGLGRRRSLDSSSRHGLPINELTTFAPPDAFANARVVAAMDDKVAERAPIELARELKTIARGF